MKISQINNNPEIKEFILREFPSYSKILFPKNTLAKDKSLSKLRKVIGENNEIIMWLETFSNSNNSNGNLSNSMILFRSSGHIWLGKIVKMNENDIQVLSYINFHRYEGAEIYIHSTTIEK